MRAAFLGIMVWLAPLAAGAQIFARVQEQPTDVAFAASNENGMLVVAEHFGTASDAGRYRFARIDREGSQVLDYVDIEVGAGRGHLLLGQRPGTPEITHVFHYAVVPAGDYALVYLDSWGTNSVSNISRWACLNNAAPVYAVSAGAITAVLAPDRASQDVFRDIGIARRAMLRRFPPGTTFEYLRSEEKAALDFAETVATNSRLTAPHSIASSVGTLAFEASEGARIERCVVGESFSIAAAQ